jgi:hypothetical protein
MTKTVSRMRMVAVTAAMIAAPLAATTAHARMMADVHMGSFSGPRLDPHFHADGPRQIAPLQTVEGNCVAVQVPPRHRQSAVAAPPLPGQRPAVVTSYEAPPIHGAGQLVTVCK